MSSPVLQQEYTSARSENDMGIKEDTRYCRDDWRQHGGCLHLSTADVKQT